ncbi:hypothetical protein [Rickettsia endosymbiont of Ixodes pacificus]|uniref:hypothetical protein n=1 Tax=Rickettsia endosymbiont of Ixodes pacificus TaxID=1133329 RepID=UPI001E3B370E|nr:hypothetical protein [Rickettsia endosymbiont of Ixodes pacificus]
MQGYRYHFVIVSDIVAGFEFLNVIPRLDRGIQSFFYFFFWIPWSSHGMTLNVILTRNDEN